MAKHRCIEDGQKQFDPARYTYSELLRIRAEQQEEAWWETCARDTSLIPARVRRWRRMIETEIHRRGL